jgi:hypothetical protein
MNLVGFWAPRNEHRIVIPIFVSTVLYRATNADFRSVIYVNILLLLFLSAASILALRSARGDFSFVVPALNDATGKELLSAENS